MKTALRRSLSPASLCGDERAVILTRMCRIVSGLLAILTVSAFVRGQSPSPAPQTTIRDAAWTADATSVVTAAVRPTKGSARLANLSVRAQAGADGNAIIAAATVQGSGSVPALVRAIGPGLARYGVSNTARSVNLDVYRGSALAAQTNTTGNGIVAASTYVGSFPLVERSDAALAGRIAPGSITAHCSPAGGTPGLALLEFYDATTEPVTASPRFVNLSARARVESGSGVMVVGFVVTGEGSVTLLLRGIGPTLQQFGVADVLRDPTIELYAGSSRIATNTDWQPADPTERNRFEQARASVGAFASTSASDAALLVTLTAGAYSLQVRGATGESGVALAEIYEIARNDLSTAPAQVYAPATNESRFTDFGLNTVGEWRADVVTAPAQWTAGATLNVQATLTLPKAYLETLAAQGIVPDAFVMLATAERTFDADGVLRLPSDERMSTLLTPTGLPIEGGIQGAVTTKFGYRFRTPVDELITIPLASTQSVDGGRKITFKVTTKLPDDLPPGIYRLRLEYGPSVKGRRYNLNALTFAQRGFPKGPCKTETYSPPILASTKHVSGRAVDAAKIRPRIPWVLLNGYNSNGYRGVVADEDQTHFALSSRNLIQDDVILPRFSESDPKSTNSYSLEPQFPTDSIFENQNIPWDYSKGQLSLQVTQPDGKVVDLGTAPFVGKSGIYPTTRNARFTSWKPAMYGRYTVRATGWTEDVWGNRYEGGGTYHFWIAKRITLATATFQGQAYPVGNRLGRDIGFAPAVPADVNVSATLYVNSDAKDVRTITFSGKATPGGVFTTAQGLKPLNFDAPGEYVSNLFATYTDADGHLWVQSMRHAGVIYPADTSIVAHGKMLNAKGKLVDRGNTQVEGYVDDAAVSHLEHIDFPYNSGDVLLIATERQYANKIEPVLSWANKVNPAPYDSKIQSIGYSNVRIQTSNGYSPHLFPEYITDLQYYYASAPRPGFMGRFIVSEDGVRAPYWHLSPQNFGGQIGASNNGDSPGEIYRLLGGVVLRNKGQKPLYAGYMANAITLPPGSKNNRVIAPGTEDIAGPTGQRARIFLAMNARPGMVYDQGMTFAPAFQIDPMLPVAMKFTMNYPDGRQVVAQGTGDASGSWAGTERWTLDVPGVYRYTVSGAWNGYDALVPGLPSDGGWMFVTDRDRPASAPVLTMNLPPISRIDAAKGAEFTGNSTAAQVYYAAVIPGVVLGQGTLPVTNGKFSYVFDPATIAKKAPTYDTVNVISKVAELGDVVHLTLFAPEKAADGKTYWSFVRLIIRGNVVHYAR